MLFRSFYFFCFPVTIAFKKVLGEGTTVKEITQTPIETPQYDVPGATKQQSDNTGTRLVNVSQQAESKRVAQEAEKVKRCKRYFSFSN